MGKTYEQLMRQLNKEQMRAVETIDGPLLVIAGPGTGKTQILSARVAHILQKTDADPASILCLTFTNKAATHLRERLFGIIGKDARRVVARTFHSFAAEIINLYPDYFFSGARLSVAPDALTLEIITGILSKLPLDNPLALKFAGQYTLVNEISQALKLVKESGLTPDELKHTIKANLKYIDLIESKLVDILSPVLSVKTVGAIRRGLEKLPTQKVTTPSPAILPLSTVIKESFEFAASKDEDTNKTTALSKWKSRWVQTVEGKKAMFSERARNEWWLKLADVYENYRTVLHQKGFYDYADMLVEVITKLEQNPEMLADIQERFNYVLIDEFQDTSAAQLRLAHLITNHPSAEGKPNLMAVGDDDQTIFKFTGAELNNVLQFLRTYPAGMLIVLKDNYRSTQKILDVSQKIINQAEDRLTRRVPGLNKKLRAVNPPPNKGEIQHFIYPTREQQLSEMARQIKAAARAQGTTAVLARSHDSLKRLSAILVKLKVPLRYEQQQNILEHPAVAQVVLIAKLAQAIAAGNKNEVDYLLSQTLRHPMWYIQPQKLWNLAISNYGGKAWLDALLKHSDKKLSRIGNWLLWLVREAGNNPLPLTLEYIIGLRAGNNFTSPLRDYFILRSNDYISAISALQLLRAMSEELAFNTQANLNDFLRLIDVNLQNKKVISDESPFVTSDNAVQLLTVHKAKGLEFDRVFIIDAIEDSWQPTLIRRIPPANLPLKPHGDDFDDYARLMFVAATRAKHTLITSSYAQDHSGKELLSTPLISQSFENIETVKSAKNPIEILEENLAWPDLGIGNESETLKARLENYNLSVTALLNFLDLSKGGPEYFKERNILRLPEAKTPSQAFGSAMHSALEAAQLQINSDKLNLRQIQGVFNNTLKREYLPQSEHQRQLAKGNQLLTKLFTEFGLKLNKGDLPEQSLKDIRVGRANLSGKLDLISGQGSAQLTITDYKTGAPLTNLNTQNQSQLIKAWRLRTQLIFYALLARNSPRFRGSNQINTQLVFVEAKKPQDLKVTYTATEAEIKRLESLVSAVWNKIKRLNLPSVKRYSVDYQGIKQFEDDLITGKV